MRLAGRLEHIEPFYVMECAKAAEAIARSPACDPARGGEPMIFLNIGEPDFTAVPGVLAAARACLDAGRTQYTGALGLPALRQAIAGWTAQRWGVALDAQRVVVTAGASGALMLACLALFEPGDEVLMADPSYPCNRHFVATAGARARLLPTTPASRFQPTAAEIDAAWTPATRGVLLASPGNPTGTSLEPRELAAIAAVVQRRGGVLLVDEIYLPLGFDDRFGASALALPDGLADCVVTINSFSKYFGMTGWRLGWLALPQGAQAQLLPALEKLAQNLTICPSVVAQHAALACFEPPALAEYERRRAEFRRRRDYIVPALAALDLPVPVLPDGAFYAWADVSAHATSSWDFALAMMERAHVALTPGRDFGPLAAERYLRLSFASSMQELQQAVARLQRVLVRPPGQPGRPTWGGAGGTIAAQAPRP